MRHVLLACLCILEAVAGTRPADEAGERDSRKQRFHALYRKYFQHYEKGSPRTLPGLKPHEVPLQFEFEVLRSMYRLDLTPRLLLLRGGIDIEPRDSQPRGVMDSHSKWWNIEVDGCGGRNSQLLCGLLEPNSVVVRPTSVLEPSFAKDLQEYFDRLGMKPEPLRHFHFTVGVYLRQVLELLRSVTLTKHRFLISSVKDTCRRRRQTCTPEYEGLLLLASMVLQKASECHSCQFPKRCQNPWLVRTNFGDMAQMLGEEERAQLASDVLEIWGGNPDLPLYPKGVLDYLRFPEFAELSGMVWSRSRDEDGGELQEGIAREIPTDANGLIDLAEDMLKHRQDIDQRLLSRKKKCSLRSATDPPEDGWAAPSAREWLEAMAEGKDLMSDHHSPLSQASLSRTLWKSMGQWRLQDDQRIFVECRIPRLCLGLNQKKWGKLGYKQMFTKIANLARSFETASG